MNDITDNGQNVETPTSAGDHSQNEKPIEDVHLLMVQKTASEFPPLLEVGSLAQKYCELGQALLFHGRESAKRDKNELADQYFEKAAQAFLDAIGEKKGAEPGEVAVLHIYLGQTREAQGWAEDALRAYLEAVLSSPMLSAQVLPNAHDLINQELARSIGDVTNKLEEKANSVELDQNASSVILNFLGRVYLLRSEYQHAVSMYDEALEKNQESIFVREGLAEALWQVEEFDRALDVIQEAIQQADRRGDYERQLTTRLKYATYLFDLERYAEAVQVAEDGLEYSEAPANDLNLILGRSSFFLGENDAAENFADKVLSSEDHTKKQIIEAQIIRAGVKYRQARYQEVADIALMVLEKDSTYLPAIRLRGLALIAGYIDPDQGLKLLQLYTERSETDWDIQLHQLSAMRQLGSPSAEISAAIERELALASSPQQAKLLSAEAAYLQDRFQETLDNLDQAAGIDPAVKSARWWKLRSEALLKLDRKPDALDSLENALRLAPDDPKLLERRAELQFDMGLYKPAADAWVEIAKNQPDNASVHYNLARVLMELDEPARALEVIDRLWEISPSGEIEIGAILLKGQILLALQRSAREIADFFYQHGQEKMTAGDYSSSANLFSQAVKQDQSFASAYWNWAESLRMLSYQVPDRVQDKELIDQGLSVWERAESQNLIPKSSESWAYVTRALLNLKSDHLSTKERQWEAVLYLERALILSDWSSMRWAALSQYYRFLNLEANALNSTARALEKGPKDLWALDERAAILANTGQFDEAKRIAEKRLEIESNAWTQTVLAYVLKYMGRYEEALENISAETDETWELSERAICLWMLGEKDEAIEAYSRILEILGGEDDLNKANQGDYANAAFNLGLLTNDQSLIKKAMDIYSQLTVESDYDSQVISARMGLGYGYLYEGRLVEGEKAIIEGIKDLTNERQVDGVLKLDLHPLQEALPQDHAGIATSEWDAVFERIRAFAETRRQKLAQPYTEEDIAELVEKELQEVLFGKDGEDKIIRTSALAGLARQYLTKGRWEQAAEIYIERISPGEDWKKELSKIPSLVQRSVRRYIRQLSLRDRITSSELALERDIFPEADLGLEKAISGLQSEGDEEFSRLEIESALSRYIKALGLEADFRNGDSTRQAGLQARVGLCHFYAGDYEKAFGRFRAVLESSGDGSEPGSILGDVARSLLTDAGHYWSLDAELEKYAGEHEPLRGDIRVARRTLNGFLNDYFHLDAESGGSRFMSVLVTPIALEVAADLAPADGEAEGGFYLAYAPEMQDRLERSMGVRIPSIRVRTNETDLSPGSYTIFLDEVPVARGTVQVGNYYCNKPEYALNELGIPPSALSPAKNPANQNPGCWVDPEYKSRIVDQGMEVWSDHRLFIMNHIEAVLRINLADFIGVQEVANLIEKWEQEGDGADLIADVLPDDEARLHFGRVLRALLAEQITIAPWREILEAVQRSGLNKDDIRETVRAVRLRLKSYLPGNGPDAEHVDAPPTVESDISSYLRPQNGALILDIPPEETDRLLTELSQFLQPYSAEIVLIAHDPTVRYFLQKLVALEFPRVSVISKEELLPQSEWTAS